MGKTKNCFIVSELTGHTLNVNDETNSLELSNRSRDTWTKYNWLIQKLVPDESNYGGDFIEGTKSQSGQLRHTCDPGTLFILVLPITLGSVMKY